VEETSIELLIIYLIYLIRKGRGTNLIVFNDTPFEVDWQKRLKEREGG